MSRRTHLSSKVAGSWQRYPLRHEGLEDRYVQEYFVIGIGTFTGYHNPKEGGKTESLLTPSHFVCLSHDRRMLGTGLGLGYLSISGGKPSIVSRGPTLTLGLLL